jgi:CBS-domain-containing membrane protein
MTPKERFIWGFCGSVAVEVITLYQVYHSHPMVVPQRYRRKGFWVVRFFLSIVAGGLALAYDIDKPLLALNIGASAPLIFQALAQGYKNTD